MANLTAPYFPGWSVTITQPDPDSSILTIRTRFENEDAPMVLRALTRITEATDGGS